MTAHAFIVTKILHVNCVAGRVLAPRGTTPMRFTIKTIDAQSIVNARLLPDGPAIVFSSPQTGNAVHLFEIRARALAARAFRAAHA